MGATMRSTVRNAARLAVYEEIRIRVKNHHTLPTIRPETDLLTHRTQFGHRKRWSETEETLNTLNPELNPICYLLALLGAYHFLHVSRIRVKSLTLRLLMSYIYTYIYIYIYIYIYGAPILDVSRSHTTTQHSR